MYENPILDLVFAPWSMNVLYAVALGTMDSACSKSAMMSSVASRPTDSRISVSEMPLFARSSGERLEWTACDGRTINVSGPPRLTATAAS